MSSLRLQILQAVVSTLNDDVPSGIPVASLRRYLGTESETFPAIAVWLVDETITRPLRSARLGGPESRVMRVAVVVVARVRDADDVEATCEPYVEHVERALGNVTLGDLAHELTVANIGYDVTKSEDLVAVVTVECHIQYQTTRGEPSLSQ